jgi:hypothetical protein
MLATAAVGMAIAASTAQGDVFVLNNGGRVVGELLNRDESPRATYVVKTSAGAELTLEKSQVQRVLHPSAAELEYERIAPSYPDTVDGQWKLAAWCLEHGLISLRKPHLERVIELDPDHVDARRALGFSHIDGKWVTQEDRMKANGYVLYKGRWRMPQEIEVLKNREQDTLHDKEWTQKITRWSAWLFTNKDQAARDNFSQITDPHAVAGLKLALRTDGRERARTQYLDTLARIGTHDAVLQIATRSVEDTAEEVRMVALDYLKKAKSPDAVSYLVGQLRNKDNARVNRAAVGLGYLGDRSAVGPLIEALITAHKFKIVTGTGGPNSLSSTFIPGGKSSGGMGGGGMGVGGGPQIVTQLVQNPSALDALVLLTGGVNYGFDVRAWKYWYTSLKQRDVVAGRRGKDQ